VGLDELVPDVLRTVAPNDDNSGSDRNSDCGRFAITETLKDLRISTVQHLGLFCCFSDGFARVWVWFFRWFLT
jgi:hypothetical protein